MIRLADIINTFEADYLHQYNPKALAKVFRTRMHEGIKQAGLRIPGCAPEKWVVDCKNIGSGGQALVYLGRYLVPDRKPPVLKKQPT